MAAQGRKGADDGTLGTLYHCCHLVLDLGNAGTPPQGMAEGGAVVVGPPLLFQDSGVSTRVGFQQQIVGLSCHTDCCADCLLDHLLPEYVKS